MFKFSSLLIGLLLLALFVGYLVTYTVPFDRTVVLTTFGRADEASVRNAGGDGAGLHFKWPWPVQNVAREYPRRVQVFQGQLEQVNTLDKQSVVVNAYVAWRVDDPLAFFKSLSTVENAEKALRDRLRSTKNIVGTYTFDQLTNTNPSQLRLDEAEATMQQQMQQDLDRLNYGVSVEDVGITRIIFPGPVTEKVFERMRTTRTRLASEARSSGQAINRATVTTAQANAEEISSFADLRAQAIRAQGYEQAAQYFDVFKQNEDLAVFLQQIQTLRETLANRSRFILDGSQFPFNLLKEGPDAIQAPMTQPSGDARAEDDEPISDLVKASGVLN